MCPPPTTYRLSSHTPWIWPEPPLVNLRAPAAKFPIRACFVPVLAAAHLQTTSIASTPPAAFLPPPPARAARCLPAVAIAADAAVASCPR
ncbi:hypothetical protein V8C26DRAFT_354379 [Trichoderma gracile]